jgi:hypothetical protein
MNTRIQRGGYAAIIVVATLGAVAACSLFGIFGEAGSGPVALGGAGNYVLLAKTGISSVPDCAITGDIGLSPAPESYLTGFSQTDATGYATSAQVNGKIYAADMAPPTPANLTAAVTDMESAYTNAARRTTPDHLDLSAGSIGGLTLSPGLYKWGSTVSIATDVTLSGGSEEVWIFQIANDLTVANAAKVILAGGARHENIIWQVAGIATLGTTSDFSGTILCKTKIDLQTGARLRGRALAQSEITLDQAVVVGP